MITQKEFVGKAIKITIESRVNEFPYPPIHLETDHIQKLTINQSGRVSFTSTNSGGFLKGSYELFEPKIVGTKNYSAGRWLKMTLPKNTTEQLLETIIAPFRSYDGYIYGDELGYWKLTAYNQENQKFEFCGDIECCFDNAEELSYHIRKTLDLRDFYAFDGGSGTEKLTYASVEFEGNKKTFYYALNDEDLHIGDKVLVPFGQRELEGVIVEIDNYGEQDIPFSIEMIKTIIKKL
ncbi:MAG: hypothetical protein IIX89_04830 [Oscillospiraceae bacterium]|nr:hypothetical protein [Oscillospiraceae bacterium]